MYLHCTCGLLNYKVANGHCQQMKDNHVYSKISLCHHVFGPWVVVEKILNTTFFITLQTYETTLSLLRFDVKTVITVSTKTPMIGFKQNLLDIAMYEAYEYF